MRFGQKGGAWMEGEVVRLRSEIWRFKRFFEMTCAPHWSPSLSVLRLQFLNHLVEDSGSLGSLASMKMRRLDRFNVLIKSSSRVTSW